MNVALIIGVASALYFSLFYVCSSMTYRLCRLCVAFPALVSFGTSFLLIALVYLLPWSTTWYVVAALVMSVGNAISASIVGTVFSDLAQSRGPSAFLSSWRLITDGGAATAPLRVAVITAVPLRAACVVLAVTSLAAWACPASSEHSTRLSEPSFPYD